MIRVLFIDDEPIERRLICQQLKDSQAAKFSCESVDGAVNAFSFLESKAAEVDIVLLDIGLQGMDGIEVAKKIHEIWEYLKIVMYTGDQRREAIVKSLRAGAVSYLLKSSTPDQLTAALVKVHNGRVSHSDRVNEEIVGHFRDRDHARESLYEVLAPREQEVCDRRGRGESYKQVCDGMGISQPTLKTYQERIRLKTLAAASIAEAVWLRRQPA